MWHRLGSQFPMVMMSAWPVYWRRHEQQESKHNRQEPTIPLSYLQLSEHMLADDSCPLSAEKQQHFMHQARRKTARSILYGFKRHGITGAFRMKRHAQRSWARILSDAFS